MKTRSIIVGTLIGPGVFGLLTALSVTPGVVKRPPPEVRGSVPWKRAERRTPGGVAVAGPCSPTIESRVNEMQRIATGRKLPGRVVYVLCGIDGNAYRTVLEYERPVSGTRFASWYPAAKFFGALSAPRAVRIDLFDAEGRRTGYVILDRVTGHVDFYDDGSRWTGYGAADVSSGEVQRFDINGRRHESTTLPILPDGRKRTVARIAPRVTGPRTGAAWATAAPDGPPRARRSDGEDPKPHGAL